MDDEDMLLLRIVIHRALHDTQYTAPLISSAGNTNSTLHDERVMVGAYALSRVAAWRAQPSTSSGSSGTPYLNQDADAPIMQRPRRHRPVPRHTYGPRGGLSLGPGSGPEALDARATTTATSRAS